MSIGSHTRGAKLCMRIIDFFAISLQRRHFWRHLFKPGGGWEGELNLVHLEGVQVVVLPSSRRI
ncbi:MAG: hypothetical protein C4584_00560 [Armatimonadetes bacterium]|nr:MAG: hypothetical protein C4584_00560 [Armatimonadota bacterium]